MFFGVNWNGSGVLMGRRSRRYTDFYSALNAVPVDTARFPVEPFGSFNPISVSLLPVEDFRTFHPLASARPVRVTSGQTVQPLRVAAAAAPRKRVGLFGSLSPHLKFAVPSRTIICIRRARRREALFANRQVGVKGGRRRLRKRNQWSDIRCSR